MTRLTFHFQQVASIVDGEKGAIALHHFVVSWLNEGHCLKGRGVCLFSKEVPHFRHAQSYTGLMIRLVLAS